MISSWRAAAWAGVALLGACAVETSEQAPVLTETSTTPGHYADPLALLTHGPEHTAGVCARGGSDPVRDAFCGAAAAPITSLAELHASLLLGKYNGYEGVSIIAHSTALATRSVSQINPRVINLRLEVPDRVEMVAVAFVRGEQLAELVVRDRIDKELRFYIVGFRQACNIRPEGCNWGDLLTPAIENDWTEVTLYDEPDVTNTVYDCATCHQPDGPGTPKLLRMQELETPWTHWFFKGTEGGRALLEDYLAAKGPEEQLAGLPAQEIDNSHPGSLNMLAAYSGGQRQPNRFESQLIEREVQTSAAALGGNQPFDNSVPGESPTWRMAYEQARLGQAMPVPYHDVKASDPQKLAQMTAAYQAYRSGELDRHVLPDLRDVLPSDEARLARMGIMTEPGASGSEVLLQACAQCHNARLDQTTSRARFRADLQNMTREEKDLAIERLQLPSDSLLVMPPSRLKLLSLEAKLRAIEELRR